YLLLAPWVVHSTYSLLVKDKSERDISTSLVFPFLLLRMLHNQIWITLSRYRTAKGNGRIVDKGIEFDQVDRERDWLDAIHYPGHLVFHCTEQMEWLWQYCFIWDQWSFFIIAVIHPCIELISYFVLFAIPLLTLVFTKTASVVAMVGYVLYIDFMNNLGHCNFEIVPKWLFEVIPPLKYLMYTPSFHSLHHTQFRTNYSLFMPFYDYIYGTMDKDSDKLHESTLKREEEIPDVVHLTHLTTPESIYHLRLGFAYLASKPYTPKWYLFLMWPMTAWSMILTWIYGRTFIMDGNHFDKIKLQTWAIPKFSLQYFLQSQKVAINTMIEEAILDADRKGIKVLSLGLRNQGEDLNIYGRLYVSRHPKLNIKIVDGSSLAVAIVLNNIPKGTSEVLLRGKLTKVAYALAFTLCQRGIRVATLHEDDYVKLKKSFKSSETNLAFTKSNTQMTWLVGDDLTEEEQLKAPKGTLFIPYTQFPPRKYRKDCSYHCTPAMLAPCSIENVHSCEDWLPRRVMSAWRIAGIVHSLEGWNEHECGHTMHNIDKVWHSTLQHGFQPLSMPVKELAYYY
ncbi:Protein ECERIFERUM 1, partial [Mucuna pruriens]